VKEYADLSRAEESFFRQKSRVQWFNLGDQNTKFFFKATKSLHSRSKIVSVCKEDGTKVYNPSEVKAEIVGFFQKLLGEAPSNAQSNLDILHKALPRRLTPSQCDDLIEGQ